MNPDVYIYMTTVLMILGMAVVWLCLPIGWPAWLQWVRRLGLGGGLSLIAASIVLLYFQPTAGGSDVAAKFYPTKQYECPATQLGQERNYAAHVRRKRRAATTLNALFTGPDSVGRHRGIVATLIQTAKLNDVGL